MERTHGSSLGWFYGVTLSVFGLWMIGQILVVIQHKSEKRRLERAYGELTKKREALQRQARTLQVELERLQSPDRLTRHAVEELGMQLPTRSQIVQMAAVSRRKTAASLVRFCGKGGRPVVPTDRGGFDAAKRNLLPDLGDALRSVSQAPAP